MPVARRAASASTRASSRCGSSPPVEAGQRRRADLDDDPTRGRGRAGARASTGAATVEITPRPRPPPARRSSSSVRCRRRSMRAALRSVRRRRGRSGPAAGRCRARTSIAATPAGVDGSQSKVTSPIVTGQPGVAPRLGQRVLDAEAGQPVAEVADGLVVVEVRLPDPALGAPAAHDEPTRQLRVRLDREAGVVDGGGPQDHPRRLDDRLCGPVARAPARPSRTSARAGPRRVAVEIVEHRPAEALHQRRRRTMSASSRGVRARRSCSARRCAAGRPARRRARGCSGRARPRAPATSATGSRPGSNVAQSTTCTSTEQRSMWRRKSSPRPRPSRGARDQPGHVGDGEDRRRPP